MFLEVLVSMYFASETNAGFRSKIASDLWLKVPRSHIRRAFHASLCGPMPAQRILKALCLVETILPAVKTREAGSNLH